VPYRVVGVDVAAPGRAVAGVACAGFVVRVNGMALARRVTTRLVDDLDGSDAVTTVSFSLDGRSFEIDLSEGHLTELRTALEPFVTAARLVSGGDGARRIVRPSRRDAAEASTQERGRTDRVRHPVGEPTVTPEPRAAAVPPVASVLPPVPGHDEAAPAEGPRPGSERKRAPLVADPFNPQARTF
jgi:Lsr2